MSYSLSFSHCLCLSLSVCLSVSLSLSLRPLPLSPPTSIRSTLFLLTQEQTLIKLFPKPTDFNPSDDVVCNDELLRRDLLLSHGVIGPVILHLHPAVHQRALRLCPVCVGQQQQKQHQGSDGLHCDVSPVNLSRGLLFGVLRLVFR